MVDIFGFSQEGGGDDGRGGGGGGGIIQVHQTGEEGRRGRMPLGRQREKRKERERRKDSSSLSVAFLFPNGKEDTP